MPAKAGIQYAPASRKCPAFTGFRLSLPCVRSAGMTEKGVNGQQQKVLGSNGTGTR